MLIVKDRMAGRGGGGGVRRQHYATDQEAFVWGFFSLNNSSGGYRACTSMVVNMTHV